MWGLPGSTLLLVAVFGGNSCIADIVEELCQADRLTAQPARTVTHAHRATAAVDASGPGSAYASELFGYVALLLQRDEQYVGVVVCFTP